MPRRPMDKAGDPDLESEVWGTRTAVRLATSFHIALAIGLTASALLAVVFSVHWPLVGDASLIHYIAFLTERGWAPYRQLGDMNMPGSFLVELAAMHLFGPGALGWRVYDFSLAVVASAAFVAICNHPSPASTLVLHPRKEPRGSSFRASPVTASLRGALRTPVWLPALFCSSLFFLIHSRDGLAQGGQRDLTMAVALLAATSFLLRAATTGSSGAAAAFGILSGLAATIKPSAVLLTGTQMLLVLYASRRTSPNDRPGLKERSPLNGPALEDRPTASPFQHLLPLSALTWLVAPALSLAFLIRERAVAAFLGGLRGIVPYYASLGHRPLAYIVQHSLSPVLPLAILWLAVLLLRMDAPGSYFDLTRSLLLGGVLFGFGNCILQARALPYYRYPLLAFLLPLTALDLTSAVSRIWPVSGPTADSKPESGKTAHAGRRMHLAAGLAFGGLAFGGLFLAPQSAILIHRYRWQQTDMLDSLQHNLQALGGPALSKRIQCIDSVSGCNTVLYRMRLEPATGVLSDFLLFGNSTDTQTPESIPVIRDTRAAFSASLLANPPQVIVVTSHLHMTGPEGFGKLARWPAFAAFLAARYTLATQWSPTRTERWWSREELPAAYRIYTVRVPR